VGQYWTPMVGQFSKPIDTLMQFLEIIRAGITIVTLDDEQEFNSETISKGMNQLLISISIMSRAHEESLTKQSRRKKAWEIGREKAKSGYKIPGRLPSWIKLSEDKLTFIIREDRAKIIRRIYELYLNGSGISGICKILNNDKIQTFNNNKNGKWATTVIAKILSYRSVIGEVQFYTTERTPEGKKSFIPSGEPIMKYFPPVIDDELFLKVQEQRQIRQTPFGRVGEAKNLFHGIAKCGYCGATMFYGVRGKKRFSYLSCSKSAINACKVEFMSTRYQDFEDVFLEQCYRLNLRSILTNDTDENAKKVSELNSNLFALRNTLQLSQLKVKNYHIALTSPDATTDKIKNFFIPLISNELNIQTELSAQIVDLEKKITIEKSLEKRVKSSFEELKKVIERIKVTTGDDRIEIRKKLQFHFRSLIKRIDFYPWGSQYLKSKEILNIPELPSDLREYFTKLANMNPKTGKKHRTCVVYFKGGGILQFVNNPTSDQLEVLLETEDGDDFKITTGTRDRINKMLRESANEENERLEQIFLDSFNKKNPLS